jgi:hypothetical protein
MHGGRVGWNKCLSHASDEVGRTGLNQLGPASNLVWFDLGRKTLCGTFLRKLLISECIEDSPICQIRASKVVGVRLS